MKCWWIELYDQEHVWQDERGDFVWAETRGKARAAGVWELGAEDITAVRALRVPAFDGKTRPTDRELLDNGYSARCAGCDATLYEADSFGPHDQAYCEECAPVLIGTPT